VTRFIRLELIQHTNVTRLLEVKDLSDGPEVSWCQRIFLPLSVRYNLGTVLSSECRGARVLGKRFCQHVNFDRVYQDMDKVI
jgi:hypothetical protein